MLGVSLFCWTKYDKTSMPLGIHLARSLLLSLAICTVDISGECQPGKTPLEAGLDFPDLSSQSFRAKMAGVSFTDYSAMGHQEHYSEEIGRGSVHNEGPGDEDLFFLFEEDRIRAHGNKQGCTKTDPSSAMSNILQVTRKALDPSDLH
ncbi:LOW QUALITY PROTEIN: hypothetical protein ElyMa_005915900 [Elysia marginata]|uniref:Uncharacterized protein n=1 Tax=Elysia marginata TaxID=1093978 RepID=A0AAV4G5R7_9GAST|nr:LOW QUALITY PROTEIN: hypothetical protein ElyMa_005915900 [Elysia marginata]